MHALLLADCLLAFHVLFIAFVIAGQAAIMIGVALSWRWIRDLRFRVAHLAAIGIVVLQAWAGRYCPLTVWENALRHSAGQEGYETTFIAHWVDRLIYYDAPMWVFTVVYSLFGALVVVYWFVAKPGRRRERRIIRIKKCPSIGKMDAE